MENQTRCPKCGSTQLTADKKGFSGKKAVAGAVLTGGIGLLAGTIGSNKVMVTCLGCGHQHQAGTAEKERRKMAMRAKLEEQNKTITKEGRKAAIITGSIIMGLGIWMLTADYNFFGWLFFGIGAIVALQAVKPLKK